MLTIYAVGRVGLALLVAAVLGHLFPVDLSWVEVPWKMFACGSPHAERWLTAILLESTGDLIALYKI